MMLVWRLVALTEELQQQREQVDEVQVQRQRTGDRRALGDGATTLPAETVAAPT